MTLAKAFRSHRIVDLSKTMVPGEAFGPVGTGKRRLEIRKFTYPPGEIMHQIDMESHIGTHVEAPSHYVDARYKRKGKDIAQIPLEKLFGEAVLIDLEKFAPGQALTPECLTKVKVKRNEIVLIGNAKHDGEGRPYISKEAARWLAEKGVKMVGIDDTVFPEEPQYLFKNLKKYYTHDYLLKNDIPLIEGLANLESLNCRRFFFIGFIAPIAGLEAFPIRAVAFVPKK
jgi:arylformamidase